MHRYLIGWVTSPFEDEYTHADILEIEKKIQDPSDLDNVKSRLAQLYHIHEDEITIFSFSAFNQ